MKIAVYDKNGKKTEASVETKIFDGKENQALLSEAVYILNSNKRQGGAKTKDRSEVSGGGIKPWRQKGTGRARVGSSRSPIWRSGGITFGPTGKENYKLTMPQKKRKKALSAALATMVKEDIITVKDLNITKPNTKTMAKLLEKLNFDRNILFVVEKTDENLTKSVRNLSCGVKVCDFKSLNVYMVLWARKIVFLGDSLKLMSEGIK